MEALCVGLAIVCIATAAWCHHLDCRIAMSESLLADGDGAVAELAARITAVEVSHGSLKGACLGCCNTLTVHDARLDILEADGDRRRLALRVELGDVELPDDLLTGDEPC